MRALRNSSAAISSFECPRAASFSTSSSRDDSREATSTEGSPALVPVRFEERRDLVDEHLPGRLVAEHDVVGGLERHEAGAVDARCEEAAVRELDHAVAVAVQHEGRDLQVGQELDGAGLHALAPGEDGDLGGGGDPLELVEPRHLLGGGLRDHHRGEDPPELRVGAGPADLDELLERGLHLQLLGRGVLQGRGVAAVEHQAGDPLGVAVGVGDGDGPALGHAHEGEPVDAGVVDNGFEVGDAGLEAVLVTSRSDSPKPRSS